MGSYRSYQDGKTDEDNNSVDKNRMRSDSSYRKGVDYERWDNARQAEISQKEEASRAAEEWNRSNMDRSEPSETSSFTSSGSNKASKSKLGIGELMLLIPFITIFGWVITFCILGLVIGW